MASFKVLFISFLTLVFLSACSGNIDQSSGNESNESVESIANAGPDQNVTVGDTVDLNGSASVGTTYLWSLDKPADSNSTLSDTTALNPTFVPDTNGSYTLELLVDASVSDSVLVIVSGVVVAPVVSVADAGEDKNITLDENVTLDGNASVGTAFLWHFTTLPTDSNLTDFNISDITTKNPTFTPDTNGTYTLEIEVDNNATLVDGVMVYVENNITDINDTNDTNTTEPVDPNNTTPRFTSAASVDVYENQLGVITLTAIDDENDSLSYSLAGTDSAMFDLNASSGVLTFKNLPDYESKILYELVTIVSDGTLSDTQNMSVNILNIAEVPLLQDTTLSVLENQAVGTTVGTIEITSSGDTNITSINLTGLGSEKFIADSSGVVRTTLSLDYEEISSYSLEAVATNSIGDSVGVTLLINIGNVGDVLPTLVDTSLTILEDATTGDIIGDLTISENGDTEIMDINLTGDSANLFAIDLNGTLRVNTTTPFDYETTKEYNLSAVATNITGTSNTAIITVLINNKIDEVAVLADSNATVDENATAATIIGNINIPYSGDSNITAINITGTGSENFDISVDGNISISSSASLDFETEPLYSFNVVALNESGESNSVILLISIADIPEVALLQVSSSSIVENSVTGDSAGTLHIVHAGDDPIDSITLSGVGSENFRAGVDGSITLEANATLDFETTAVYTLSAVATNDAGDSLPVTHTINVLDYIFNPFQIAKIQAGDADTDEYFASSVAANAEYFLIGAKNTTEGSEISAGSAYLFVKDEQGDITQKAKLVASDGQANDNFGDSVALSDSYIIVGAPNEDDTNTNAGSVYIFDINGSSTQKIQASSPSSDAYFGSSVAISNEYLVVGAEGANGFGRAYVFKKSGGVFSQIAELEKSSPVFNDLFASSVSISENYIVVGAKQDDTLAPDAGNAYLYKIQSDDSVTFEDEVSPSDGEDSDFFGASVAVSGNYIVVGAYQEDTTASNAGSAYVFGIQSDDTALELVKLQASDASIGDNFGNSVAISADKIVVGAYKKESFIQANGSVYQFDIESDGTITQNAKMQASDAQGDDYFGNSVAISGDYIVVGAEYEDTQAQNAGSAYIFDGEPVDRIYVYNAQDNTTMLDEGVQKDLFSIDAASPNGGLTYSLSGSDMDSFELSGATVLNTNPFDYELPEDSDLDNSYSFSVTLSDAGAKSTELLLSIDIEDKHFLELSKEGASDADIDDRFGESMAMSDEYIVVGAPSEDTTSLNAGALYLFKKNADASFTEVDKVQASDAQADDYFAKSVAISGEYVVVGAPQEDSSATDAGSVYLFKIVADELVQLDRINASNAEAGDMFGSFVSISANYFVVGAPDKNTSTGSAYLYKIQSDESVTEVTTITADNAQSGDIFASSLAIDGEYIVVGAKNENSLYVDSGAAYVYKIVSATTVLEIAKLKADNAGTSNLFGSSVSISGDYVSVGASHKDSLAQDAGMAYLFVRESDTYDDIRQIASFQASDAHSNDYFGSSLAMDDKQIVVGAFGSLNEGSAYLYNYETNGSVLEVQKFRASVNDANNYFGASLSVDSQNIAIGSFKESVVSTDAGAIYTYENDLNQTP